MPINRFMAMRRCAVPILALVALLFAAPMLMGQSQTISGAVVDPSGGVVPGAQVRIVDTSKGTLAREVLRMKPAASRP